MWRPARFVSTLRVHRVNQGGGAGRVYKIQSPTTESSDLVVPSVTSVLNVLEKAALLPWAIRICLDDVRRSLKQHRNRAGDVLPSEDAIDKLLARAATAPDSIKNSSASFGTRVHAVSGIVRPDALNLTPNSAAQAIDAIITGMTPRPPVPSDIAATVAGFEAWYATSGIRFASAGDTMVYSREHGYAGAADCIGYRLDGSAIVVCDFKTSNSTQQSYALQVCLVDFFPSCVMQVPRLSYCAVGCVRHCHPRDVERGGARFKRSSCCRLEKTNACYNYRNPAIDSFESRRHKALHTEQYCTRCDH